MIIVRFTSGLGNQMYQYNFYRYLCEKYPATQVLADLTWFYANNDHHGYELDRVFGLNMDSDIRKSKHKGSDSGESTHKGSDSGKSIQKGSGSGESIQKESDYKIKEASKAQIFKVTGQIPPLVSGKLAKKVVYLLGPVNRILREHFTGSKMANHLDQLNGNISNKSIIENGQEINPFFEAVNNLDTSKDWYITGFFIEEKYHKERLDKLKAELVFPNITDADNTEMLEDITNSNSVSIHVRRGDYLSQTYSGMFKSLGKEYYQQAVKTISERIDNPRFFLFSDDPEYMDKAFAWLANRRIVNINSGDNSFRDMQLMSCCKHNIIANSTFSQWAALLNKNEGHITAYPAAYLADEDTEVKSIEGFIRI